MEADIFQFMLLVLASSAPHDDHDLKFWHVPSYPRHRAPGQLHNRLLLDRAHAAENLCSAGARSSGGRCLGRESRVGELGLGPQQLSPALHGDRGHCRATWGHGHGTTWHPQYMTPDTCPEEAGNAILPHTALHPCPICLACFLTGPKKTLNLWYLRLLQFLIRGHWLISTHIQHKHINT